MSSINPRIINVQPGTTTGHPYFLIIMTNYPDLLQRTHAYQQPNQHWQQQQQQRRHHPGGAGGGEGGGGGMLLPGVRVHFGPVQTEDYERLLYNTLRYQLQQIMRTYFRQTHQLFPIYLVFDMSSMYSQL